MGRPTDISPKAYLRVLFGYSRPFDRHDWVVLSNGEEVRYVIDFYTGDEKSTPSSKGQLNSNQPKPPISMHLDVRPALDSPSALYWRIQYNITKLFNKFTSNLPFSFDQFSIKTPTSQQNSSPSPSSTSTDPTKEKS